MRTITSFPLRIWRTGKTSSSPKQLGKQKSLRAGGLSQPSKVEILRQLVSHTAVATGNRHPENALETESFYCVAYYPKHDGITILVSCLEVNIL